MTALSLFCSLSEQQRLLLTKTPAALMLRKPSELLIRMLELWREVRDSIVYLYNRYSTAGSGNDSAEMRQRDILNKADRKNSGKCNVDNTPKDAVENG